MTRDEILAVTESSKALFERKDFTSHSGLPLHWKIDCDALTDTDIETLAWLVAYRFAFHHVIGIPRGGIRLAKALEEYRVITEQSPANPTYLVVDDVYTTGDSMEKARIKDVPALAVAEGVVIFARNETPPWIHPIFQLWGRR